MALAAILGTANAVDMPTRQAFSVDMVGRDDVTNAVGLNSALFNGSRIVGPAVAGVLIGVTDISAAFLVNGVSYLGVIAAYLVMRDAELRPVDHGARPTSWRGVVDNLAEGARYVRHTPLVLLSMTVIGLVATFGMNFQVLIPPLADQVLDVGASGFGFLMAASGLGSTIAALAVAFSHRVRPALIALGAVALGLGSIVLAWSTSFGLSLAMMAVAGAGGIAMMVTANTMIQTVVPDQLRGRVMSVYTTSFSASVPAGGLLMGGIASAWGVPLSLGIGGVLSAAVGAAAWVWLGRIRGVVAALPRAGVAGGAAATADPPLSTARR
jgi:MFS family permease